MKEQDEYIIPGFLETMEYGFEYLLFSYTSILIHRTPLGEEILRLTLSLLTPDDRVRLYDDLAEQQLIDGKDREDYIKEIGHVDDLAQVLSCALLKQPCSALRETSIRTALSEILPLDERLSKAQKRYNVFSEKLMSIFHLSMPEVSLISFCMCFEYNSYLEKLFDVQVRSNKVSFLSIILEQPQEDIKRMLSKNSDIIRKGLIDYPRVLRAFGHFSDWISLNAVMNRALSYGNLDSITDHFFIRHTEPIYPLASFSCGTFES